ncbi:NAD-P-binding protein [Polyporus arcularius HHB13444]|uniref:NAD-P-binding protein n=1 Tax=Polyporus arcularius HHB13444 TaxID=1314778 RepID=A0A5C3PZ75_9APHY|nr:NAD-P-binding protein [Polyporus arcularius HHB13444]
MVEIRGELVWFITGTSSGLGRALVYAALKRGDCVIATARSLEKIEDFPKTDKIRLMQLDVTEGFASIQAKLHKAIGFFGRVDVVVNNAGTGVPSILEEGGSDLLRKQFDVNLFGLADVTNATLPHMRLRRSGTVVLIGSRSSWAQLPVRLYASSKAAVRVLGEGLNEELTPFGIRTLIVEPGLFRTNFLDDPVYAGNPIPDYDVMREEIAKRRRGARERMNGDPAKAMELLVDVVRGEGKAKGKAWPLYLPLGWATDDAIQAKTKTILGVLDEWRDVIRDLDYDQEM